MKLTQELLHELIPYATDKNIGKFISPINETLYTFNINTKKRIAAFLAQIEFESGSLKYMEEIADGSAYEYRKDLGNLYPEALEIAHSKGTTTGKFYKGRGLIQITGYYNYRECGEGLELDLTHEPDLLKQPRYAALSAGWYWNVHNCNNLAEIQDFPKITKVINGSVTSKHTHYKERLLAFKRNNEILGIEYVG